LSDDEVAAVAASLVAAFEVRLPDLRVLLAAADKPLPRVLT